jgi:hypothetical protein
MPTMSYRAPFRLGLCAIAVWLVACAIPPLILGMTRSVLFGEGQGPPVAWHWSQFFTYVPTWTYVQAVTGVVLFVASTRLTRFILRSAGRERSEVQ